MCAVAGRTLCLAARRCLAEALCVARADGCWFWPLLPPYSRGTGVFVNTGNTLVLDHFNQAKALKPTGAPCVGDCLEAVGAAARGYDTVQMLQGKYMHHPELLVARPPCLRPQNHSEPTSCPPPGIELRAGRHAGLPCRCSSAPLKERVGAGASFINCHGHARGDERRRN